MVSIVTPTLKRKNNIIKLLNSLNTEKKWIKEIIIVEQVDNNQSKFKEVAKQNSISLKYTFLPTKSTSKAKNIGATQATGEIILFLDDDVVATKKLIQNHIQNYTDPSVAAVCGRSITTGQEVEESRTDTGRISNLGTFSDGYSSTVKQEIDTVIGCNASWRKSVFNEIGGFDEQFTGNAMREESDLSLRAKKVGYKILFEPKALVYHTREPTGGARKTEGRLQWYYDFFSNEVYFFLKHRHIVLLPIYLIKKTEWAIRCMLGFGREVSIRSFVTPMLGVLDGLRKYRRYLYENRD